MSGVEGKIAELEKELARLKESNDQLISKNEKLQDQNEKLSRTNVQGLFEDSSLHELKFRDYVDNSPTAIFSVSGSGNYTFVNRSAANLLGYSVSELLGKNIVDVLPEDQVTKGVRSFDILRRKSKLKSFQIVLKRKDGALRSVFLDGVKINGEYLGFVKDITDFLYLKQDYKTVFNSTQDAMFLVEVTKGGFKYVMNNKTHRKKTGLLAKYLNGKSPQELLGDKVGGVISSNYQKCVDLRAPISYEERLELPAGFAIWATTLTPVFRDGVVKYIVGSSQDRTNEVQLLDDLMESLETNKTIFSILGHDLRSPFSSIVSLSELLVTDRSLSIEEKTNIYEHIFKTSRNGLKLLDGLLEWYSSLDKLNVVSFKEVNLYDVVSKVYLFKETEFERKKLSFENELSWDVNVVGDEYLVSAIFRNLISNSLKFTERGSIKVSGSVFDKKYELVVSDTGVGMGDDVLNSLFSGVVSNKGVYGEVGLGLGLKIVSMAVNKLKGDVRVESKVGKGTQVYVSLPLYS